jgi:hypothetical protein
MKEERVLTIFTCAIILVAASVFAFIPISAWKSAGITKRALNSECGTNYTQWDTLFAGESLTELCRIKQQELFIKQ